MLPIINYRPQILSALSSGGSLIVTAPPGTGKSTQIPQFLADRTTPRRKLLVLEPRRIAARALAYRVSEEIGTACGEKVGYQVRFERKASPETGILFLTYGAFLRLLGSDPAASDASVVAFDEFHERSLDADTALAWVRRLCASVRPDLKIMALSATLAPGDLCEYLDNCAIVSVPDRLFPVDVRYQPPGPREPLEEQVLRGLAEASAGGIEGSVLVFLPGSGEIERAADRIKGFCKRKGFMVMRLHGRMPLALQQETLRRPALEPCVILSTNVAETSLTIPGVTAVIDSGLARVAGYDPERERNTLHLGRISMQNAVQRTGRAGRLGPGVCVRLWSRTDEAAMPPVIEPEVMRLDLAPAMLTLCNLQQTVADAPGGSLTESSAIRFLTPPPVKRWEKAAEGLMRCGAVTSRDAPPADNETRESPLFPLTKLGAAMSRLPLEPAVAAVLLGSRTAPVWHINIVMAALWESDESKLAESRDLFDEALDFSTGSPPRHGSEVRDACDQIGRLLGRRKDDAGEIAPDAQALRREATLLWLRVFSHRLGVRMGHGTVYRLADSRSARLTPAKSAGAPMLPECILALSVHERTGRETTKKAFIPLYLPVEAAWIAEEFGAEFRRSVECSWDETRQGVNIEEQTLFRGIPLRSREVTSRAGYRNDAAAVLAEHLEGFWDWRTEEPGAAQFVLRTRLVADAFPEKNIPKFTGEDLRLVYHGLCDGKFSRAEVRKGSMLRALNDYLGPALALVIERKAPEFIILPSGKKARITYVDGAPPELSARLGDLIGFGDRFTVADGRVGGVFDILAPNRRTVQKTPDLGSFWRNTYPRIKREMQRKYPRHPWP